MPDQGHESATHSAPGLLRQLSAGVLRLTFDRPEVGNAMTGEMMDQLSAEIEGVNGRDDIRVIVLAGSGNAFCTGADIGGEAAHTRFDSDSLDRANRAVRAIIASDLPVLSVVNGAAAGVGASLVFASDLVIAAESAQLVLAFSRIGLMPDGGATATVAASIGRARAMRMAMLAESLPAPEAFRAGLISHLASDQSLERDAEDLIARLVTGPPLAYAATKRAVNGATLGELEPAMDREHRGQTLLLRTHDAAEGMRAFSERRRPDFAGH